MKENDKMNKATKMAWKSWSNFTKVVTYSIGASVVLLIILAIAIA